MRSDATELTRAAVRTRPAHRLRLSRGMVLSLVALVVFVAVIEGIGLGARAWSSPPPVLIGRDRLIDPWMRWDAQWYLAIADSGYSGLGSISGTTGLYQQAVAFPPLFPISVRGVGAALHLWSPEAATLLVGLSLLVAVVGLYRLASMDGGSRVGVTAVVMMLSFPTAFFLVAPYAEAPVLALGVWSFVAARQRRWVIAALLVGAAVAAKLDSVVLVAGLLVEVVGAERGRRALAAAGAIVVAPAAALGGWMAWQAAVFGDPLRFVSAENAWGRHLGVPMSYLLTTFPSVFDKHTYVLPSMLDIAAPLLLLGLGVRAWRVRRSYSAVLILSAVLFSSTSVYDSIDRYSLVVFPLFIVAGVVLARRPVVTAGLSALSTAVGGTLIVLFSTGHFIG